MDLPSGREEYGLQGGVQKSELLRRRDVKFVHVRKCEAAQPLGFYVVRPLHQHVAAQCLTICFQHMILFQFETFHR